MPYATIDKPSSYFDTKLYNGTGSSQSITGLSFKPDWVWIKERTATAISSHNLFDAVRGVQNVIFTNSTLNELSDPQYLTAFNSDGFTLGTNSGINESGSTVVSWNWLGANTTVSNTQGTITSTVSANPTSGFSIAKWSGTSADGTVGHGLGVTPDLVIVKNISTSYNWFIYHRQSFGDNQNKAIYFTTGATTTGFATQPFKSFTSSTVQFGGNDGVNGSTYNYVGYFFANIKGFSKFGSYTGNGSTDGTFVYTGFKPAFVLVKDSSAVTDWNMYDNKRNTYNVADLRLYPNLSNAEATYAVFDFVSNGFKIRNSGGNFNTSGDTYIYMAFAENPFVTSKGLPVTAR